MKATKINIYDLYRNINDVKEKKHTSYNEVLTIIHDRIKKASKKEQYKFVYEVPEYLFGVPSYNLNKCLAYLIKELRNNGFLVKYYFPKILYISWDPIEITNYKKEKKLYQKKFKDIRKDTMKIANSAITSSTSLNNSNYNSNYETNNNIKDFFQNQSSLVGPSTTQHSSSIFKPILNYDPNTIPTYNYYAYSTLNNNLANDNFYITNQNTGYLGNENNNQNTNDRSQYNTLNNTKNIVYNPDNEYLKTPEHLKNVKMLKDKKKQEVETNMSYQKDILDYYNDEDDELNNPFKNTIKKHNSKGKFILDLS
jgi:hypothetical protein